MYGYLVTGVVFTVAIIIFAAAIIGCWDGIHSPISDKDEDDK